ncbi:MAG: hypothetical protein JW927_22705 [Deltaproteobacteria bacterium]|nr:hypothetical protein [Deltaproteobacteria bacterium]
MGILLVAWIITGCDSSMINKVLLEVRPVPESKAALLAGIGKADITPRPGLPTAGYATNGRSGIGFCTRLYGVGDVGKKVKINDGFIFLLTSLLIIWCRVQGTRIKA